MGVDELIELMSVIAKSQRVIARADESFNVFKLCGVNHYETMHSRIVADFLNPQGLHGMGDVFLSKFFEIIKIDLPVSSAVEVTTELSFNDGRCDIVLRNRRPHDEWVVIIENKIYANEQRSQMPRYWSWIKQLPARDDKSRKLVFLTLDGHSSETAKDVPGLAERVICVSYRDKIREWLDEAVKISAEHPFVRESLRQYKKLIESLTYQKKEEEIMKELKKRCLSNADTYDTVMKIAASAEGIRSAVAEQILLRVNKRIANECPGLRAISTSSVDGRKYSGFGFSLVDSPVSVYFEFQKADFGDLCGGLIWNENIRNADYVIANENLMNRAVAIGWKPNAVWATYKNIGGWADDVFREAIESWSLQGDGRIVDGAPRQAWLNS